MYFLHDDSRSGIGNCGSLSCAANVIPGLDWPFLLDASGDLALSGYDWLDSFAAFSDRSCCNGAPLVSFVSGILVSRTKANFWSRDEGLVNDLTAMAGSVMRRWQIQKWV
jgi:hypothetical protein